MAATLITQLYSQNHWADLDGVQTVWNFTFAGGYILPAHVKAYYLDANGDRVDITVTEEMLIGEFQLEVTPAVPASAILFVIYRDTPKDLPLVDFTQGARQTERNLDRLARQAIFVAAECIDATFYPGLALEELGFKDLKKVIYTGASTVQQTDRGRAHFKTDGSAVTVPNTLRNEFLCSIVNYSANEMTVTFTGGTARLQGATDSTANDQWTLAAWNTLHIWKAADGGWLISGKAGPA
jgi:hypothetical protein